MKLTRPGVLLTLLLASTSACVGLADDSLADPAAIGVNGGGEVAAGEFRSVVALAVWTFDGRRAFCSGTLVSPRVVVTAAHCLATAAKGQVVFGETVSAGIALRLRAARAHPEWDPSRLNDPHDIAVIQLDDAVDTPPARILGRALEQADVDAVIEVLGFGLTDWNQHDDGVKRRATARIRTLVDDEYVVEPESGRPCYGDSGGPSFLRVDGAAMFIGVHSRGDQSNGCVGSTTTDVRLDRYWDDFVQPFIDEVDRAQRGYGPDAAPTDAEVT